MEKRYNILIVEDEFLNAQLIEQTIEKLGHNVISVTTNAKDSYEIIKNNQVDLIFMDINIEGSVDGILCAKEINKFQNIPIIYATAYSNSDTIKKAANTNIFGYLIKPFDDRDIEATLNVALISIEKEKNKNSSNNIIDFGNNYIYFIDTKSLYIDNKIVNFTKKEIKLFELLIKNINMVTSYELLRENIWEDKEVVNSTIRDSFLRLRKKIPFLNIENITGLGYILKKD